VGSLPVLTEGVEDDGTEADGEGEEGDEDEDVEDDENVEMTDAHHNSDSL